MVAPRAVKQLVIGLCALGALAAIGCSEDGATGLATLPTRVAIHPSAFLGDLPCSTEPGAMRSYVVTLYAWNGLDDVTPFTVGSSYPTSCARTVAFENVVSAGTYYTADVQGYAEVPESLEPFGGYSSGSSTMLDLESGEAVEPRWRTRCGASASEGVQAVADQARFITHCTPLEDSAPTPTAIRFAPDALFGPEPCQAVSRWSVYPEGSTLAPLTDLACDSGPVDYTEGVVPGSFYSFYVSALLGQTAFGTECYVDARPGVTVSPTCGALRSDGYVDVDLDGLLVDGEPFCAEGGRYTLALEGAALDAVPLPCGAAARVGPLEPADYQIDVALVDGSGEPTGAVAICSATAEPGRAVDAVCAP